MPYFGGRLVRATLAGLPQGLDGEVRLRWSEEIEGDHASYEDRPIGGLLYALRLRLRGGERLAKELAFQQLMGEGELSPEDSLDSMSGSSFDVFIDRSRSSTQVYVPFLDVSSPAAFKTLLAVAPNLESTTIGPRSVHLRFKAGADVPRSEIEVVLDLLVAGR